MKKRYKPLLVCACTLVAICAWSVHAETQARKKARYYYSAGIQQQAMGNDAEAYEYFKKSYAEDPTYSEGALAFGTRRLYVGTDTMQSEEELDRSFGMMKAYVDQYPDDVYESVNYGYIAGQLGHTDEAVRVLERVYSLHPETSNVLLELSDVYARAYDLPNAIDAIDRYERQEGLSPAVTTRKLSYLLANNDTVRALSEAKKLVQSDPSDVSYRIIMANVFDIIEMPDSAYKYYRQAEEIDPESGAAKLALAGYYLQTGDSVKYDAKMYEVLLTEDLDLDQKTDLVVGYLDHQLRSNQDPARGDYLFSVLKSQYPHEPRVLDLAARYSAAKGDFKDAIEQMSYAIDLNPTNSTYWGQLITYQTAGDKLQDALKTYDKAKDYIQPDNALKLYYASVAQMAKDYDKSISVYKEMIRDIDAALQPDTLISLKDVRPDISLGDLDLLSQLFTYLGDAYNMQGKLPDSYRSYENAIVLDSKNSMAKNNYAYFMSINGGDLEKAQKLSSEAISGDDAGNPTYIDTFAWISFLKGDIDTAEEYQNKAVDIMKGSTYRSAEIYDHLGDILEKKGKIAEAVDAWKEAVKIQEEQKDTEEASYQETLKKIKINEPKIKDLPPSDNAGN